MIPSWTALDHGASDAMQFCRRRFYAFPTHLASSCVTREEAEKLHEKGMALNPNSLVDVTGKCQFISEFVAFLLKTNTRTNGTIVTTEFTRNAF